jgi:hypothetical protein
MHGQYADLMMISHHQISSANSKSEDFDMRYLDGFSTKNFAETTEILI